MHTTLCPLSSDFTLPLVFVTQGGPGHFHVVQAVPTQSSGAKVTSFYVLSSCSGPSVPGGLVANLHILWTH